VNKAFGFEGDIWNWFEGLDNRSRFARFSAAMIDVTNMTPQDEILHGLSLFTLSITA
jgi:hypothetical protein